LTLDAGFRQLAEHAETLTLMRVVLPVLLKSVQESVVAILKYVMTKLTGNSAILIEIL
jgi:hypothetical protein